MVECEFDKLPCGCHVSVRLYKNGGETSVFSKNSWVDSICACDLENDLGPIALDWFDQVSKNHLNQSGNTDLGSQLHEELSPCLAGGITNVSAPLQLTEVDQSFQGQSPLVLPYSPKSHSTPYPLYAGSPGGGNGFESSSLVDIECDMKSTDLIGNVSAVYAKSNVSQQPADSESFSWSTFMATPPLVLVKSDGDEHVEHKRQKPPVRVLFPPSISVADSDLSEIEPNVTVEQLDGPTVQDDSDGSLAFSPAQRPENHWTCQWSPSSDSMLNSDGDCTSDAASRNAECSGPAVNRICVRSVRESGGCMAGLLIHRPVLSQLQNRKDFLHKRSLALTNSSGSDAFFMSRHAAHSPVVSLRGCGVNLCDPSASASDQSKALDVSALNSELAVDIVRNGGHHEEHHAADVNVCSSGLAGTSSDFSRSSCVDETLADFLGSPESSAKRRKGAPKRKRRKFHQQFFGSPKIYSPSSASLLTCPNNSEGSKMNSMCLEMTTIRINDLELSRFLSNDESRECQHTELGAERTELADVNTEETSSKQVCDDECQGSTQLNTSNRACRSVNGFSERLPVSTTPPSILRSTKVGRASVKKVRFVDSAGDGHTVSPAQRSGDNPEHLSVVSRKGESEATCCVSGDSCDVMHRLSDNASSFVMHPGVEEIPAGDKLPSVGESVFISFGQAVSETDRSTCGVGDRVLKTLLITGGDSSDRPLYSNGAVDVMVERDPVNHIHCSMQPGHQNNRGVSSGETRIRQLDYLMSVDRQKHGESACVDQGCCSLADNLDKPGVTTTKQHVFRNSQFWLSFKSGKTAQFLYPTNSQIEDSSPSRTFNFNAMNKNACDESTHRQLDNYAGDEPHDVDGSPFSDMTVSGSGSCHIRGVVKTDVFHSDQDATVKSDCSDFMGNYAGVVASPETVSAIGSQFVEDDLVWSQMDESVPFEFNHRLSSVGDVDMHISTGHAESMESGLATNDSSTAVGSFPVSRDHSYADADLDNSSELHTSEIQYPVSAELCDLGPSHRTLRLTGLPSTDGTILLMTPSRSNDLSSIPVLSLLPISSQLPSSSMSSHGAGCLSTTGNGGVEGVAAVNSMTLPGIEHRCGLGHDCGLHMVSGIYAGGMSSVGISAGDSMKIVHKASLQCASSLGESVMFKVVNTSGPSRQDKATYRSGYCQRSLPVFPTPADCVMSVSEMSLRHSCGLFSQDKVSIGCDEMLCGDDEEDIAGGDHDGILGGDYDATFDGYNEEISGGDHDDISCGDHEKTSGGDCEDTFGGNHDEISVSYREGTSGSGYKRTSAGDADEISGDNPQETSVGDSEETSGGDQLVPVASACLRNNLISKSHLCHKGEECLECHGKSQRCGINQNAVDETEEFLNQFDTSSLHFPSCGEEHLTSNVNVTVSASSSNFGNVSGLGFHTASGKVVSVSEKALAKSKKFLCMDECNSLTSSSKIAEDNFDGQIEQLDAAHGICQNSDDDINVSAVCCDQEKSLSTVLMPVSKGKSSTDLCVNDSVGHVINCSEMYHNPGSNRIRNPIHSQYSLIVESVSKPNNSFLQVTENVGDTLNDISSGKAVGACLANKHLHSGDICLPDGLVPTGRDSSKHAQISCGFQTASGGKVTVSHKSLRHSSTFLNSCKERMDITLTANGTAAVSHVNSYASSFKDIPKGGPDTSNIMGQELVNGGCGFSTASGHGITVSEMALKHAQEAFPFDVTDGVENCAVPCTSAELVGMTDGGNHDSHHERSNLCVGIVSCTASVSSFVTPTIGIHQENVHADSSRVVPFEEKVFSCGKRLLPSPENHCNVSEDNDLASSRFTEFAQVSQFNLSSEHAIQPPVRTSPVHRHQKSPQACFEAKSESIDSSTYRSSSVFIPPLKKTRFSLPTYKPTVRFPASSISPGIIRATRTSLPVQGALEPCSMHVIKPLSPPTTVTDDTVLLDGDNKDLVSLQCVSRTGNTRGTSVGSQSIAQGGLCGNRLSGNSESKECGSAGIKMAMLQQEKIIMMKRAQTVKPVTGRWLTQKLTHHQEAFSRVLPRYCRAKLSADVKRREVSSAVKSVSSRTAGNFRFFLPNFYPRRWESGVTVGDGALLVADACGYAGKDQFVQAFLTVPGVDPGLVAEGWIRNHYRWIVWKLAAYELALPDVLSSRVLTPDTVMLQLKYRYDREVDLCQRSSLKLIVERDDTACKRLVLCVSDIKPSSDTGQTMLELCDGWYSIPCLPDEVITAQVQKKRLRVGQKIITCGAQILGSQEPCSPLELPSGVYLKIHGNSTRPAPGLAKLGFQPNPTPLCVPLSTIQSAGGVVGCADVVVTRKYPIMFMEKSAGGSCVFRTTGMEDMEHRRYEEKRQQAMETLCVQLLADIEKEEEAELLNRKKCQQTCNKKGSKMWSVDPDVEEIADDVSNCDDIQGPLTGSQMIHLEKCHQRRQDLKQKRLDLCLQEALQQSSYSEGRQVVPVQKFLLTGCCTRDVDVVNGGFQLTVWRPGEQWLSVCEGGRYLMYRLSASPARAYRMSKNPVELTAGRHTRLLARKIEENLLDLVYEPREVQSVHDLMRRRPPYGEFDFVGMVTTVRSDLRSSDAVYAVDSSGGLLVIWFKGGLQTFNLEDKLVEMAVFAATCLRLKYCCEDCVECTAVLEMTSFSTSAGNHEQHLLMEQLTRGNSVRELNGLSPF